MSRLSRRCATGFETMGRSDSSEDKAKKVGSSEDEAKEVSRRGFVKWAGALAAAGAVGFGVGFGGDMLLRPNTQTTTTETTTETTSTTSTALGVEQISYTAHRTGPLRVHVVNGRWVRSSAVKPNLPTAYRLLGMRNRTYAPDRVLYPMKRVGWAPGGKSDNSTRGKGNFVRITWEEAYSSIVSEFQRIYKTYGPSAVYAGASSHQWPSTYQNGETWPKRVMAAMGGYTAKSGGESFTGWNDASYLSWGAGVPQSNSFADIIANSKILIYWAVDHGGKGWVSWETSLILARLKAAGVKLIVIDPWFNETAAHNYPYKHISVVPGTDEALLAAIAYTWITEGTFNQSWLDTHTLGFDEEHLPSDAPKNSSFKSYILGTSDGTPKTPAWASAICGVRKETILALAHEWAANPTFVDSYSGGAQRRAMAGQFVRMLITVCAMQGMGMSGRGLGWCLFASSNGGISNPIVTAPGLPGVPNPVTQLIHHTQFPDAILNPPISWTTGRYACHSWRRKVEPILCQGTLRSRCTMVLADQTYRKDLAELKDTRRRSRAKKSSSSVFRSLIGLLRHCMQTSSCLRRMSQNKKTLSLGTTISSTTRLQYHRRARPSRTRTSA